MHRAKEREFRISVTPEFYAAILRMAAATPRGFLAELLECAIVDTYERRFGEPTGHASVSVETSEGPGRAT